MKKPPEQVNEKLALAIRCGHSAEAYAAAEVSLADKRRTPYFSQQHGPRSIAVIAKMGAGMALNAEECAEFADVVLQRAPSYRPAIAATVSRPVTAEAAQYFRDLDRGDRDAAKDEYAPDGTGNGIGEVMAANERHGFMPGRKQPA